MSEANAILTDVHFRIAGKEVAIERVYGRLTDAGNYVYKKYPQVQNTPLVNVDIIPNFDNDYSEYGFIAFLRIAGGVVYCGGPQPMTWQFQTFESDRGPAYGARLWLRQGTGYLVAAAHISSPWSVIFP